MIGAGAKTLFATDCQLAGVKQVAEKLPAGRGFIAVKVKLFGDRIKGAARRH